jgi:hypothetical protein
VTPEALQWWSCNSPRLKRVLRLRAASVGRGSSPPNTLKPRIEELTLMVYYTKTEYNFPCSLLSDGIRNSIRYLKLGSCGLHPAAELGPLRSLTSLCLWFVSISRDELESLLSNCLALEQLELTRCMGIIWLKISCALEQLSSLCIYECWNLKMIRAMLQTSPDFSLEETQSSHLGKRCKRRSWTWIVQMLSTMLVPSCHPLCQILKLLL